MSDVGDEQLNREAEETEASFWMAYYGDWSGFVPFEREIDALRFAVARDMKVMRCPFGVDPRGLIA